MPRYDEAEAREAVAASRSYSETLRRLGMRPAGGNHKLLRKWVDDVWKIPTGHFDPNAGRRIRPSRPLSEVMVEGSTYSRTRLKRRLLAAGIKQTRCELCGQGEEWRGRRMALILDHINGQPDDHRLENLRIVCPNCAATLDTHCGRKNRPPPSVRDCEHCGRPFSPVSIAKRFCSKQCGRHAPQVHQIGRPHLSARKAQRPPYEQLIVEIDELGYLATGRKYGVSDNAIRKWVIFYERERERRAREASDDNHR